MFHAGLARPVRIGNRYFVDGAVHSINNADCVQTTEPGVVIVSAPLSSDQFLRLPTPIISV